jgi:Fur family transcriptional regulator, ferric uptake regulator
MEKLLKSRGLKVTPARVAILEAFARKNKPLDANKVLRGLWLDKSCGEVDETTVFRNLEALTEAGLLRIVDLRKDSVYFELNHDHHHHIVCVNCDKVEEFANEKIEKILESIIKKSSKFKNITEHSLELFGLCAKCS